MKKVLFVAAFLTAGIITTQAQIKFGVKAGANFYKFTGDDADLGSDVSAKFRVGVVGGGLVNIPINEQFSVQPEALYSMEGSKYSEGGESVTFKVDFVNIPVLFQYNNPSGFYAETGPQIGFLTSAKLSDGDDEADYKELFKGTAFSWAIGAGYRLPGGFGIGARYNLGLNNIADSDDADLKTSGFNIGVHYTFGGSKK